MDVPLNGCCCPKCSQPYTITSLKPLKGRLPLVLPCKHSVCSSCVILPTKLCEQLQCPVCEQPVELPPKEEADNVVGDKFPINAFIIGDTVLKLSQQKEKNLQCVNPYINLKGIIKKLDQNIQNCSECKEKTRFKCNECKAVYCENCFSKVHTSFQSLKLHEMVELGFEMKNPTCEFHPLANLEYYCETCQKPLCLKCLLLKDKECSSHNYISIEDKNLSERDKLKEVQEKGDEMFRRLTKTAVDIGNRLDKLNSDTDTDSEVSNLAKAIENHYNKLHACIQVQMEERLAVVRTMSNTERDTLENAKKNVEDNIVKMKTLLNQLNYVSNKDVQTNVSGLVQEMESLVNNTPWYLNKVEPPSDQTLMKMNDEVFKVVSEHLTLEASLQRGYTLLPTKDVPDDDVPPAPARPIFPPEIVVMDVREKDKKEKKKTQSDILKEALQIPVKEPPPRPKNHNVDFVPSARAMSGSQLSLSSLHSNDSNSQGRNYKFGNHHMLYEPRSTSQEPPTKPLLEGSTDMVYLVHITDPEDFYVHRCCQDKKLRELKNDLLAAASFNKPAVGQITEGKLFVGLSKLTNQFQRCRILNVNKDNPAQILYFIFYLDHGQTDVVTINELRMIPSGLALLPAMALHCKLANVRPISGQWDQDDTKLIHQITLKKKLVMFVHRSLGASHLGLHLECDLITLEDGVNLATALVFHERAKLVDPHVKYHRVNLKEEKPKLFFNPDMKKNSTEEVVITYIVSPDKFYIRKTYLQSQYDRLLEEMDSMYSLKNRSNQVFCPEIGMTVACNTDKCADSADGSGWRRGVVLALPGKARVVLSLPDSGHEVTTHVSALRTLHQRFYSIKALAVECHLSDILPSNNKWSRGSVDALEQYSQQALKLLVVDLPNKNRSMGVRLYDETDQDEPKCINEEFIKEKYAINIGTPSFAYPKASKTIQDKAPVSKKKAKPQKVPEVRILKKGTKINETTKEEKLDVTVDRGPVKLEVKILSCQSPSQLYVSLVSQLPILLSLFNYMHTFYSETPPQGKEEWQVDEKCCVFYKKKKSWNRATVLQVEGEMARIFYVDIAEIDNVPTAKLLPLDPEFQKVPNGAFKCHLSGIMPAGGADWPGISCESLNEFIEQYTRYFITKKGIVKDKSMPVELWVYHVTPGGALDPSKAEWLLLNAKLVQHGLAIPDRDSAEATACDDTLSILAATGTVSQWLQLRSPETKDDQLKPLERVAKEEEEPSTTNQYHSQKLALQNWLPAIPIAESNFDAIPTYVDNDGYVYFHPASNADIVDLIAVSLASICKNREREPSDTLWVVGQACIAVYGLDGQYYRGSVVEIHKNSNCSVCFVDYGNVEFVSTENMRKDLVTLDIPIQAHRAQLAGIKFVGGKKRIEAIDYLHKVVSLKQCTINVLEKEGIVYIVDLFFKGMNINKLLVETRYASFVATADDSVHDTSMESRCDTLNTDSEPDYIIEDDNISDNKMYTLTDSQKMDWNKMIDEEINAADLGESDPLTYPAPEIPIDANGNFKCMVEYINNPTEVHLSVCDPPEQASDKFNNVIRDIQEQAPSQPVIKEIYEGKACVAIYEEDRRWYRSTVVRYDPNIDKIVVLYVDYGNHALVDRQDVRESKREWCNVAPAVIRAQIHDIRAKDTSLIEDISAAYKRLLLRGEQVATVLERTGNSLVVELRKEAGGPLIYQELLDKGILVLK